MDRYCKKEKKSFGSPSTEENSFHIYETFFRGEVFFSFLRSSSKFSKSFFGKYRNNLLLVLRL